MNVSCFQQQTTSCFTCVHTRTVILEKKMKAFVCTFLLLFLKHNAAFASITLLDTGETFGSVSDATLGECLWRGFKYKAHLQYIANACDPNVYYNLTVPDDGLPVVLIDTGSTSRTRNDCSMEQKAKLLLFQTAANSSGGLVQYLIVDDNYDANNNNASYYDGSTSDDDIPLTILHVSTRTHWALLDHLAHQSLASKRSGGLLVSMDSRTLSSQTNNNGGVILWIVLAAMTSACGCTFLLMACKQAWMAPPELAP
jgi:hypothetical protein